MAVAEPPPTSRDEKNDDGTMTILEHLQELRHRMMICAIAVGISLIVSFYPLTQWAIEWLKKPAESRVDNFHLVFTEPLGFWGPFFSVSLKLAIAISMPVLIWQVLAFVGPGLTKNEKRWAFPIVIGATAMFVLGCAFAYYVEMPPALNFLLHPPGGLAEPFISVKSYIGFASSLMLVTGLVFETPLLIMGLAKVGVISSRKLISYWRFAIVGAFVVSAVVTPSIDPITQTLVAVPIVVLYFFGCFLARMVEKNPIIRR
jgi:sec-independent protein translocase protein TatC